MNVPNGASGRASDLKQIRGRIDGDDIFMSGHRVRYGSGRLHSTRGYKIPKWAKTDVGIQELLLRVFPKLKTDERQRQRAARWAKVIYLYFRAGMTYSQIAEDMHITRNAAHELVKSIHRTSKGLVVHGGGKPRKPRGFRPRGRPKKIATQAPHPLEEAR